MTFVMNRRILQHGISWMCWNCINRLGILCLFKWIRYFNDNILLETIRQRKSRICLTSWRRQSWNSFSEAGSTFYRKAKVMPSICCNGKDCHKMFGNSFFHDCTHINQSVDSASGDPYLWDRAVVASLIQPISSHPTSWLLLFHQRLGFSISVFHSDFPPKILYVLRLLRELVAVANPLTPNFISLMRFCQYRCAKTAISKRCLYMHWTQKNVTYRPIGRQRLGKHIPAGANERNNRTSIARQRISKLASLIIEAGFCVVRTKWL
jgi:hypothetical protein